MQYTIRIKVRRINLNMKARGIQYIYSLEGNGIRLPYVRDKGFLIFKILPLDLTINLALLVEMNDKCSLIIPLLVIILLFVVIVDEQTILWQQALLFSLISNHARA